VIFSLDSLGMIRGQGGLPRSPSQDPPRVIF
jgi:hypothetical protein